MKENAKYWLERRQLPALAKAVLAEDEAGQDIDPGPERVIEEGIAWLGRAQDNSTTQDGGVAGHYSLINGWSASYPETTGYIVPTMLAHGHETGNAQSIARARRMLDWLVSIQFPEGGFQGGMINQTPRVLVTFNTGQALIGLAAGAALDPQYLEPMRKAADWLVATQDPDGCWRNYPTPFAAPGEKTYETHVALGLMHAATVDPDRGYLEAAVKQIDWALKNQAANGWFADCCLSDVLYPLTHTLGYALRGVLGAYYATGEERYLRAACLTADGLLSAQGPNGRIRGRLDSHWRKAAAWSCLTGISQIAESWLLLHKETGRNTYRRAGLLANAFVRRTISMDGPPEIRGGVKGSFPVDGGYGRWQYLSWACKFTIDANREEMSLT